MISELNVVRKICADLALFGGKKYLSIITWRLKGSLELTVGTLMIIN